MTLFFVGGMRHEDKQKGGPFKDSCILYPYLRKIPMLTKFQSVKTHHLERV